ncbi:creatininase family protein [Dactylosporangium salmoneum]|uniref:creatininase family protein n=1 Tax=Dactylosporangium salmoneum TaxID=53361 RepID=UPI003CD06B21
MVNGHGGNVDVLRQVSDVCEHEGMPIFVHHLTVPGGAAHAGPTETSLVLPFDPARVRRRSSTSCRDWVRTAFGP